MKHLKSRIKEYSDLIKFEHTIFALPFALSGMLLASKSSWPGVDIFLYVILALVGARTAAMALNRIIDANIDKQNPRTSSRAIPSGRIKKVFALVLAFAGVFVLIAATWQLPLICKQLLPLSIFILVIYSYTKRFTNLSHFVLGTALGAGASGGWLAVSGSISLEVVLWGLSIVFWVAGFDVIYAMQDIDFDRSSKLFSIPVSFGIRNSLIISSIFHITTVVLLMILAVIYNLGLFFWAGLFFMSAMLIYEHSLISSNDLSKINKAFFNVNAYVSIGMFLFILADKIVF